MNDTEGLAIRKGGKLIETYWHYNAETKKGAYQEKDVTASAIRRLFESCELEDNITLKDIFLLMQTELELFDTFIGNWCEEIITEGLTGPPKINTGYDPEEIEYFELDKTIHTDPTGTYGTDRPDFGGKGWVLREDKLADWKNEDGSDCVEWTKGSRIPWGVSCTPANEIINIPVRLKNDLTVYNNDIESKDFHKKIISYPNCGFTLGDILNGIIWELSFFGGPASRDKAKKEMKDSIDEALRKEGGSETI